MHLQTRTTSTRLIEALESRRLLSFSPAATYPLGGIADPSIVEHVVTADFNNDGKLDLATANNATINVLLGAGNGTFQAPTTMTNTAPYSALAVGDFNKDGKSDLVIEVNDPEWDYAVVQVKLGNGQGGFSNSAYATLVDRKLGELAVGDFNADGKLDVVISEITGQFRIDVLPGNGDGTLASPAVSARLFGKPVSLATGDLNGDGKLDVVIGADQGISDEGFDNWDTVIVLPGNGQGYFGTPHYRYLLDTAVMDVAVGDLNGDGKLDVATANWDTQTASVLLGNGDGTLSYSNFSSDFASGGAPYSVALGDFNSDGARDIVTANLAGDDVSVLLGHGDGTFSAPVQAAAGPDPRAVTADDFNRDGRLDLAVAGFDSGSGANTVSVLLNDGNWVIRTYVGPNDGNWSTASNWSPSGVPTAGDFVTISGKSVILSASATFAGLTMTAGASLTVACDGSRVLRTSTLFVDGNSKLDLNDNAMIVDYNGASPLAQVRDLIVSGRNGGPWNGSGIASSAAAAETPGTGLGYAEASDRFTTFPANFGGQSVDATSLLVRYTLMGDANLDGAVNVTDLGVLATNWQQRPCGFVQGDFDYSAEVDVADLGMLATNWQGSLPAPSLSSVLMAPARRPISTRVPISAVDVIG